MAGSSRAWFVDRYGGPERLVLRERPDPVPGPGEVLVKTAAIALNFADLFVRAGVYPRTPMPPFVPGMEISGTIEAVGDGVTDLDTGQQVVAVPLFGGHAEKVAVPAAWVFPLPDGVDLVAAAAMPVAFLTAWYALARAEVGAGDRVVVTAAAGGVGTALLQLLPLRSAKTLALVGSESKFALCRELGALDAGLYSSAGTLLDRHFGGRTDVVVDAIGGKLFRSLWRRLDRGGRYALYGFATAAGPGGVAALAPPRSRPPSRPLWIPPRGGPRRSRPPRRRARAPRDGPPRPLPLRRDLPHADRLQPVSPPVENRRAPPGRQGPLRPLESRPHPPHPPAPLRLRPPPRRTPRPRQPLHHRQSGDRGWPGNRLTPSGSVITM